MPKSPCPHCDMKIIQFSNRQSAVVSAVYQNSEQLFSEYDQKQKYDSPKSEIVVHESKDNGKTHSYQNSFQSQTNPGCRACHRLICLDRKVLKQNSIYFLTSLRTPSS